MELDRSRCFAAVACVVTGHRSPGTVGALPGPLSCAPSAHPLPAPPTLIHLSLTVRSPRAHAPRARGDHIQSTRRPVPHAICASAPTATIFTRSPASLPCSHGAHAALLLSHPIARYRWLCRVDGSLYSAYLGASPIPRPRTLMGAVQQDILPPHLRYRQRARL